MLANGTGKLRKTLIAKLSWAGSTDNVGVAKYGVYRDGSLLAWVAGTAYSDTSTTLGGIYTYTVVAIDAAGNTSAASASVTLTR